MDKNAVSSGDNKKHICTLCNQKFINLIDLQRHQARKKSCINQIKIDTLVCKNCNKKYLNKYNLIRHMNNCQQLNKKLDDTSTANPLAAETNVVNLQIDPNDPYRNLLEAEKKLSTYKHNNINEVNIDFLKEKCEDGLNKLQCIIRDSRSYRTSHNNVQEIMARILCAIYLDETRPADIGLNIVNFGEYHDRIWFRQFDKIHCIDYYYGTYQLGARMWNLMLPQIRSILLDPDVMQNGIKQIPPMEITSVEDKIDERKNLPLLNYESVVNEILTNQFNPDCTMIFTWDARKIRIPIAPIVILKKTLDTPLPRLTLPEN